MASEVSRGREEAEEQLQSVRELPTHSSAGRRTWGWLWDGGGERGGGELAKVPCQGPTDGNYQQAKDDLAQTEEGGSHISKNISDLMKSMSIANSVFIRLLPALKTPPFLTPCLILKTSISNSNKNANSKVSCAGVIKMC